MNLDYWESKKLQPDTFYPSSDQSIALERSFARDMPSIVQNPFKRFEDIREWQFQRIQYLVKLAYNNIPIYHKKYSSLGLNPNDVKSWDDFYRLPIITKDELIEAFPHSCVDYSRFNESDLFATRSTGSSGRTVKIRVDFDAIVRDTLQGVRQYYLQSGLRYKQNHNVALIYTVPWWFRSIGEEYKTYFISSLIKNDKISSILRGINPQIISCYPSNLRSLLPYIKDLENLYLVIVHSEQSSKLERDRWSKELGIPILDEYSSEEATRIALEFPCGHYHICENTVYLESINPNTMQHQTPGKPGWTIVTNLLNEAMPFIRYFQGDLITLPEQPDNCLINWGQIQAIEGRANDSFKTLDGREICSGTLLDITYRWMYDLQVNIREFKLVQKSYTNIDIVIEPEQDISKDVLLNKSIPHLKKLLEKTFGYELNLNVMFVKRFDHKKKKRFIQSDIS